MQPFVELLCTLVELSIEHGGGAARLDANLTSPGRLSVASRSAAMTARWLGA